MEVSIHLYLHVMNGGGDGRRGGGGGDGGSGGTSVLSSAYRTASVFDLGRILP